MHHLIRVTIKRNFHVEEQIIRIEGEHPRIVLLVQ